MMTWVATFMALQAPPPDYAEAMRKVSTKFTGKEGVVIHIGDSITYANSYGGWARYGKGKTPQEQAICTWMHVGAEDETDGWFLARVDRPGNRSDTAASGVRSDEYIAGGKGGLPPLGDILKKYNPQMAVVLLGTNDLKAGRSPAQYKADMTRIADVLIANGTIPILSTIPPVKGKDDAVKAYNGALAELAKEKKLPLIDFCGEILKRRPDDWLGTLISGDGVHPSGDNVGAEPTEENLKSSGQLLRGVLTVRKIAEVKAEVLDAGAPERK